MQAYVTIPGEPAFISIACVAVAACSAQNPVDSVLVVTAASSATPSALATASPSQFYLHRADSRHGHDGHCDHRGRHEREQDHRHRDERSRLTLDQTPPTSREVDTVESSGQLKTGQYRELGTWDAAPLTAALAVTGLEPLHAWLGVEDRDDESGRIDVRVQLLRNGTPFALGEVAALSGLERGQHRAREVVVPLDATSTTQLGVGDVLSLKVLVRVAATSRRSRLDGVVLFFDGASWPSHFGVKTAVDVDGDGFSPPSDCDDTNAAIHPGAVELCDGLDNNCAAGVDEGVTATFFQDADADGFGNAAFSTASCTPAAGFVADSSDCNDTNAAIHPGAPEVCDGVDNNCAAGVDEGVTATFFQDADGDGFGNAAVSTASCTPAAGFVADSSDCSDTNAAIHPGAPEVCDGVDNNCAAGVDEGVTATFFQDSDGDGFGNAAEASSACTAPAGYVADSSDCDDADPLAHVGPVGACQLLGTPPPLPRGVRTSVLDVVRFRIAGDQATQFGVQPGVLVDHRVGMVDGTVMHVDGTAFVGARVEALEHPEWGFTLTDFAGRYVLVINGGGPITLKFSHPGVLISQRHLETMWQESATLPPVVLVAQDPVASAMRSAAAQFQVGQSSLSNDANGARRITLLLPPGVTVEAVSGAGVHTALPEFHLRMTEYTVGPRGPAAMPLQLPVTSAYTYAVELAVDEAESLGAVSVQLSAPAPVYVDNFLNLPTGSGMPAGFVDRLKGAWIAQKDGVVMRAMAAEDGAIHLDSDGDGVADDGVAWGVTLEERVALASLYPEDATFWRVEVNHFTPYDFNAAPQAAGDVLPPFQPGRPVPNTDQPDTHCGSIIRVEERSLGESIPIPGTAYRLVYTSARTRGVTAPRQIDVPLLDSSLDALPPYMERVTWDVNILGRHFGEDVAAQPHMAAQVLWDGTDADGRTVQGPVMASLTVFYWFRALIMAVPGVPERYSFAAPGSAQTVGLRVAGVVTSGRMEQRQFRVGAWDARALGMGGFSLDKHHVLENLPVEGGMRVLRGDGSELGNEAATRGYTVVAGTGATANPGSSNHTPDGPGTSTALFFPTSVAVGPDGTTYFLEYGVVRRINADGSVTTVAGGGTSVADDIPALSARLDRPNALALGPDGSLYISMRSKVRVRTPDGFMHTLAGGGGLRGSDGDFGQAADAQFDRAGDITVGPDGALYFVEGRRIRRVDAGGAISWIAGNGSGDPAVDGEPATQSGLVEPRGIHVKRDGTVLVVDASIVDFDGTISIRAPGPRILSIGPRGSITTLAGGGTDEGEGVLATSARLTDPRDIAETVDGQLLILSGDRLQVVDRAGLIRTLAVKGSALSGFRSIVMAPDGTHLVVAEDQAVVVKVHAPYPGIAVSDVLVPEPDGRTAHVFTANGQHVRTVDAVLGFTLRSFEYNASGLLVGVVERTGDRTVIERDGNGNVTAMVGPYGRRTELLLDANGNLLETRDALDQRFRLTWHGDTGLLASFTRPKGNTSVFSYNAQGQLMRDQDAVGGFSELDGSGDVALRTAEGRVSSFTLASSAATGLTQTSVDARGLSKTRVHANDDTAQTTHPSGVTQSTTNTLPDPHFGMQAPVADTLVEMPSGRSLETLVRRELTATGWRETRTVGGRDWVTNATRTPPSWSSTSPEGRTSTAFLDAVGQVQRMDAPGMASVVMERDVHGRPVRIAQGAGAEERVTLLTYDDDGTLASATDALEHTTAFTRDALGRVTTTTLPGNRQVSFTYDQNGNVESVTPPGRDAHVFAYSQVDEEVGYVPPDVGFTPLATLKTYNLDHQLTSELHADGRSITHAYDAAGRLTTTTLQRGTLTHAYSATSGNLESVTSPDGITTAYTFDGALLTAETISGLVAGSVGWEWDA